MSLEKLQSAGEISRQPVAKTEIGNLLKKAARKLNDAKSVSISSETRLEQAYTVVLTCASIALRANGYRVTSLSAKHYITIETLRYTLCLDDDRIEYYQSLRALRNRDIYGADIPINDTDLAEAIEEATDLLAETRKWQTDNHPDLV